MEKVGIDYTERRLYKRGPGMRLPSFLAGSERRSEGRLKEERARHPIWTVDNACFFAFLLLFFVPALIGLIHIIALAG